MIENVPRGSRKIISIGVHHSLEIRPSGSVVGYGKGYYGQCSVPYPNMGFITVVSNGYHSLGLKEDGSIVGWGNNDDGQYDIPEPNTGFIDVYSGYSGNVGLKNNGSIVVWH